MKAYGTIYAGTHSGLTGFRTSVTAPGTDGFCVVQDIVIDDIRICDITRTYLRNSKTMSYATCNATPISCE